MSTRQVMVFTRFERFWHWTQAALIALLLVTGAGLHGLIRGADFGTVLSVHVVAAVALIVLWIFAIFWHLTTGQWRHYLPHRDGLWQVARYYAYDIFRGRGHPYRKTWLRKHNPLQAASYLVFKLMISPVIWATGLALLTYDLWTARPWGSETLWVLASLHTAAAFLMAVFLVVHVYVALLGETTLHYVRTMITGYDEVDVSPAEAEVLAEQHLIR